MTNKKHIINDEFEFGIDSRYKSKKEKNQDSISLMQARLERMKNVPREQIVRAKLLQLKINMQNYLKEPVYANQNQFAYFLQAYIDAIYSKRSEFAKDLSITPVFLSQVINNHREPSEEFILKLMIHSEKVFKYVSEFDTKSWFQVYFHEKISETMYTQDKWRPKIEKQVKLTESIGI